MSWLQQIGTEKLLLFMLVLARVTGLLMTAPVYATSQVPMQVRALLSFALALVILPTQWHLHIAFPGTLVNWLVFLAGELTIGAALGLAVQILLSGVQMAGQMIAQLGGEAMASMFDPTLQEDSAVLAQLLYWVALAMFLCIGGHRIVMAGLLDTFQSLPPGCGSLPTGIGPALAALLAQSFRLAVQAAAPVMAALLMATVVVGLIGRTLPQLNVLAMGFGLNWLVMAAVLFLALGGSLWLFQDQLEPALAAMLVALQAGLRT